MTSVRIYLNSEATLEEALENSYRRFKLENIASLERCRLVAYDSKDDIIQCSLNGKETEYVHEIFSNLPFSSSDLLLEIRDEDADFEIYVSGDIETKVYTVDTITSEINGPVIVRVQKTLSIEQYKHLLAKKLGLNADDILVAVLKYNTHASLLETNTVSIDDEDVSKICAVHPKWL